MSEQVLPAIYSNPPPEAIASIIEARYPLGEVESCRLLSRGNNDLFLLRLASGQRVVARLNHRRVKGPGNTAFETSLLMHLKAHGASVAAPIPAIDGALWRIERAPEGEREFAVFEFMHGAPVGAAEEDMRLFGRTLGRMHQTARAFDASATLYCHDLESILLAPSERLASVSYFEPALSEEIRSVTALARERLEPMLATLTWQINHGDPAPVNCHAWDEEGSKRAGLIDFEDCQPGWLAWEISHVLFHLTRFGEPGVWTDEVKRRWLGFIEGLASVTPIANTDLAAVIAFIPVRWLAWGTFFADRLNEWGSVNLQPAWLEGQLAKTRKWLEISSAPTE